MGEVYTLYGSPHSLYTGKTRSYLRKQGVKYVELTSAHPSFRDRVMPAIGRAIIPVIVTPDGAYIQDTVDILDHFEDRGAVVSARPPGARQRVLAHLIELYAVVGLTRHAMHYRWSVADQQRAFLEDAFASGSGGSAAKVMERMASYLPGLGVTADTIPLIERSYERLLDTLNAHFTDHPYLFGAQPSIGDYGLLGPLFAHLGRDPVPSHIMKTRAPKVFRWVERMNAPDPDMPDYVDYPPGYLPGDEIPATLLPLLDQMSEELFPELTDKLAALADHVAETRPAAGQAVAAKPHQRIVGMVDTSFCGAPCQGGVQPYMMILWQRVTDAHDALDDPGRTSVANMFNKHGLSAVLSAARPFRVGRRNNIEVWDQTP